MSKSVGQKASSACIPESVKPVRCSRPLIGTLTSQRTAKQSRCSAGEYAPWQNEWGEESSWHWRVTTGDKRWISWLWWHSPITPRLALLQAFPPILHDQTTSTAKGNLSALTLPPRPSHIPASGVWTSNVSYTLRFICFLSLWRLFTPLKYKQHKYTIYKPS